MAMFLKLPHEICREIGSYLDYESRMNYNRNVEFNDRYTKRLESDKHNFKVKVALICGMLDRQDRCVNYVGRVVMMAHIFSYLVYTRDTALLDNPKIALVMLVRSTDYSTLENVTNEAQFVPRKIAKRLVRVARKLVLKLKNGFT